MEIFKILKPLTPFSILYLLGTGIVIYSLLFPGRENWGYLTAYVIGVLVIILFFLDIIMRLIFKEKKMTLFVQGIIVTFFIFQALI